MVLDRSALAARFGRLGNHIAPNVQMIAEIRRHLLHALVFEQLLDQLGARVFLFLGFWLWQQHFGLDIHQLRCHRDKVTGYIQVHRLCRVQHL